MVNGTKELRVIKASVLGVDAFWAGIDNGDHVLINILSFSKGIGVALAGMARLSKKFEIACKPEMKIWPECESDMSQTTGELVHTVKVVFRECIMSKRFRSLEEMKQPCHYTVEMKRTGQEKIKTILETNIDEEGGDIIKDRDRKIIQNVVDGLKKKGVHSLSGQKLKIIFFR